MKFYNPRLPLCFTIICCSIFVFPPPIPANPGYKSQILNPEGVKWDVGGLGWLSDGRLALLQWGGKKYVTGKGGKLFLLSGVGLPNPNLKIQPLAEGFEDPLGLAVHNDTMYVTDKRGVHSVSLKGDINLIDTVPFSGNHHQYHFGAVFKDGAIYSALGQSWPVEASPGRGALVQTSLKTGQTQLIAGGLRESNGMGLGPGGDIFIVDNQGHYLPSSKLIHAKPGEFYGFENSLGPFNLGIENQAVPAVWFAHHQSANAPAEPVLIPQGLFQGQLLVAEYTKCRVLRIFLEKVKGAWQGALFFHLDSKDLQVGPNRLIFDGQGRLYIGGMGNVPSHSGGIGWRSSCPDGNNLQRMTPIPTPPFEVKAIRSLSDGFEVEFTRPIQPSTAQISNFDILRWGMRPGASYGAGNAVGRRKVNPLGIGLKEGNYHLKLNVGPADLAHNPELWMKSTVFQFDFSNIISADGAPLFFTQAWYTLNHIGPADRLGCKDNRYKEFDINAMYDDGFQCKQLLHTRRYTTNNSGLSVLSASGGTIQLRATSHQRQTVQLIKLQGRAVSQTIISGPGIVSLKLPATGIYIIRSMAHEKIWQRTVCALKW